ADVSMRCTPFRHTALRVSRSLGAPRRRGSDASPEAPTPRLGFGGGSHAAGDEAGLAAVDRHALALGGVERGARPRAAGDRPVGAVGASEVAAGGGQPAVHEAAGLA